jgi:hypothetical protein
VFVAADGGEATPAAPSGGAVAAPFALVSGAFDPLSPAADGNHALVASVPALADVPALGEANEPACVIAEGMDAERAECSSAHATQLDKTRLCIT